MEAIDGLIDQDLRPARAVSDAGGGRGRPIDTKASNIDPALLQLVVGMNLFGTVYTVNAVAPIMKEQRSGKIITVSSVAGTGPSVDGGYAHYGAAKAAIAHYTRYLAQDLGPFGITANCIAPGVIATGRIMATVIPGSVQGNQDRTELVALRRLGTVDDCAKVVEFLATDLSDYVTGAVIPSMAGWCADSRTRRLIRWPLGRRPRVCFCIAIERLHEHCARDDQADDQLVRARGEACCHHLDPLSPAEMSGIIVIGAGL